MRRSFKPGARVRVGPNIALDHGKVGTLVGPRDVRTDGRGIPRGISGAYKPVDWKNWVVIRVDDTGELILVPKVSVLPE